MSISGSSVGVIGGSIAGCAAAIACRKAGVDVVVYERSRNELKGRGLGIALPVPVFEQLSAAGYLDDDLPMVRVEHRVWLTKGPGTGRIAWRQPFAAYTTSWGMVWRALRRRVPDEIYRSAQPVAGLEPDGDGVWLSAGDAAPRRFDAVVGADGYRSLARALIEPGVQPAYAGYVLWRGDIEQAEMAEPGIVTACFEGGHAIFYTIPGMRGETRVNWALYGRIPPGRSFTDPTSLPPGRVPDDLVELLYRIADELLAPYWAGIVHATARESLAVQPIYDRATESYGSGRVLLAGDAGTIARPHTGSGAMKAMLDGLALQEVCQSHDSWADAVVDYDARRRFAGNALVELGQRLGRPLVTASPPWDSMGEPEFAALLEATLAGRRTPYDPVEDEIAG